MVIVAGTSVSCSGPSLANERRLSRERLALGEASW